MIHFRNDYSEGAHPLILQALADATYEQNAGYGMDEHCKHATELIQKACGYSEADVHFFTGGTQANLSVISAILRPYEAVIATKRSHINTHETGAIEATGHKVIAMPGQDGKLTPEDIIQAVESHTDEHMVKPTLVYISNTTEIGSVYTKQELHELRNICNTYHLYLFMDGARLANALTSKANDLTLKDIAWLTDAFYIGGTKNGALLGEACVITNALLKPHFRYNMKQKGALSAKSFVLGIEFETLMMQNLYLTLGKHANQMASIIADALIERNVPFLSLPVSNQIFPVLNAQQVQKLQEQFDFEIWEQDGDYFIIRLVTSWATRPEQVQAFVDFLPEIIPDAAEEVSDAEEN
jgi:threonine aldolase